MISGTKCRAYGMCAQCIGAYQRTEHFIQQCLWLEGFFPSSCDDHILCDPQQAHKRACNSRPDICYVLPDRVLVVEVDERSHCDRTTDNELLKLDKTRWGVGADKAVVVVRFNPDLQAGCAQSLLDVRLPHLAARLRYYFLCPLAELDPIR